VGAIRAALDDRDHQDAIVCSHAAKNASSCGLFRDAAGHAFGDPGGLLCPSSPGSGAQDDRECLG